MQRGWITGDSVIGQRILSSPEKWRKEYVIYTAEEDAARNAELARLRALCGRARELVSTEYEVVRLAMRGESATKPIEQQMALLAEFEQAAKGGEYPDCHICHHDRKAFPFCSACHPSCPACAAAETREGDRP